MKIIFTGPECCGKTTLVKVICGKTDFIEVPEMARDYLEKRNNIYDEHSLIEIGLLQYQQESNLQARHKNICCDTDLLTILIWQKEKFQKTDPYLWKKWIESQPDIYFLCAPDIDWVYDSQRENPLDRERLFILYQDYLKTNRKPYFILKGSIKERVEHVISIVQKIQ